MHNYNDTISLDLLSEASILSKFMLRDEIRVIRWLQLDLLIIEIKRGGIRIGRTVGSPGPSAEINFYHEHVPRY